MIRLTASEIAAITGGLMRDGPTAVDPAEPVVIDHVVTDSRLVERPGALFVALRGSRADGHAFVADAAARGAGAVVVTRQAVTAPVAQIVVDDALTALGALASAVRTRVAPWTVGITGSVGKTTVKDFAAAAIAMQRQTVASQASFNNELGVPLTLLALEAGTDALVVEMGARRPGDIAALAEIARPDVAVITAVAGVHLEPFGSIEAIARTKGELVAALRADGIAVLNADDPRVASMADGAPRAVLVSAAGSAGAGDVVAEEVVLDRRGHATVRIASDWGGTQVRLPLPGRHQVINALLAIAAAAVSGVSVDVAAAGVAEAPVSPWRGQVIAGRGRTVIDDAYNANPVAVRAALDNLAHLAAGRPATAVLGEMAELGERSSIEHEAVGEECAARGVERVVVVGGAAAGIAMGARRAGVPEVVEVADPAAAVAWLDDHRRDDEVVLVKASRVAGLDRVVDLLTGRGSTAGGDQREGRR